jgi:lysophospholipase L1-like esterase
VRYVKTSLVFGLAAVMVAPALPASADAGQDVSVDTHCTGSGPITCHIDVPVGHYKVTAVLGGEEAATTSIWAEQRRLMLAPLTTEAGHRSRQHFLVNVRDPEGEPTGPTGSPGLDLRFDGQAPHLHSIRVTPVTQTRVVYLAGDSTTCDQPTAPYTGWGQMLPARFRDRVSIANYGDSGESTGSFLDTPALFPTMQPLIDQGDYVFIQFGHNDKQTTKGDYQANLRRMIEGVRSRKGLPVLVSPPVRRLFDRAGKLTPTALHVNGLGVDQPAAMHEVAEQAGVPMIDLTARSRDLLEAIGPAASLPLYLPEKRDNTHFSELGANVMADLVLAGAKELDLTLVRFLR